MSGILMDMSDHDINGSPAVDANDEAKQLAAEAAPEASDLKKQRALRLAAALRTNLHRRKMPGAASRPAPKDQN
ncbi:hypothetical protein GCM10009093_18210 [Brevundimonas terrae]|uniref:Uncharacterized protein n=1 Tax=Brevundimonas terrae TaxID=363631 RepID=A0ABN0YDK6_9CAUL|nr:hypothetical protein [Brevundimonas terrae]NIJ26560.1 hypothetical protein [Brevundimonas terrae]